MTFVAMALVAIGCSGGAGTAVSASSNDTQPPANPDQPPSSASDQAPSSSDQPPANPDTAPGGAAISSGAGNLGGLCQKLCKSVADLGDRCTKLSVGVSLDKACGGANPCQVPANTPCQSEIAALFSCVIDNLDLVCVASGDNGNSAMKPQATACEDALKSFGSCSDAQDNAGAGMVKNCTPQGDCECTDDCQKCVCKAAGDLQKSTACVEAGGACAP
jgi:hypothetical protein